MKQSLKLDVPDVSPLEQLLGSLSSSKKSSAQPSPSPMQKPTIGKVERSALLGKLKQFIPELEKANQKLEAEMSVRPASEFDVENVEEGQAHIEMDLACGIIDLKDRAAEEAAEGAVASGGRVDEDSCDDDDEETSEDGEEEPMVTDEGQANKGGPTNKLEEGGPRKRKHGITEL